MGADAFPRSKRSTKVARWSGRALCPLPSRCRGEGVGANVDVALCPRGPSWFLCVTVDEGKVDVVEPVPIFVLYIGPPMVRGSVNSASFGGWSSSTVSRGCCCDGKLLVIV